MLLVPSSSVFRRIALITRTRRDTSCRLVIARSTFRGICPSILPIHFPQTDVSRRTAALARPPAELRIPKWTAASARREVEPKDPAATPPADVECCSEGRAVRPTMEIPSLLQTKYSTTLIRAPEIH